MDDLGDVCYKEKKRRQKLRRAAFQRSGEPGD